MRMPILLLAVLLAACTERAQTEPSPEEARLLAYLVRDPYVVVDRTERDLDGNLLVITTQGSGRVRYLLASDDPARPELRLRRLDDACTLDTAPNPHPGGGPEPRGLR